MKRAIRPVRRRLAASTQHRERPSGPPVLSPRSQELTRPQFPGQPVLGVRSFLTSPSSSPCARWSSVPPTASSSAAPGGGAVSVALSAHGQLWPKPQPPVSQSVAHLRGRALPWRSHHPTANMHFRSCSLAIWTVALAFWLPCRFWLAKSGGLSSPGAGNASRPLCRRGSLWSPAAVLLLRHRAQGWRGCQPAPPPPPHRPRARQQPLRVERRQGRGLALQR